MRTDVYCNCQALTDCELQETQYGRNERMSFRFFSLRRRRLLERPRLTDAEFIQRLGPIDASPEVLVTMRRCLANMCRLPADRLYDSDDFALVDSLVCSGFFRSWDALDFILRIELELKRQVRLKPSDLPPLTTPKHLIEGANQPYTIGEWFSITAPLVELSLGKTIRC